MKDKTKSKVKDKNKINIKYEIKDKPYLVMSKKDCFGKITNFYYGLHSKQQLENIPTENLKNGDIAVVKDESDGQLYKHIWVDDIDLQYCGWSCGEKLSWNESEKIKQESENKDMNLNIGKKIEEEKEIEPPLCELTCEQIKAKYSTLNSLYYNCWYAEKHYILNYCNVEFISHNETNREAKVTIRFKSNVMNCNDAITFTVDVISLYNREVRKNKYSNIVSVRINEMQQCDVLLLKFIVVTSELLEAKTANLDLSETINESYDRLIGLLDEFKLFKYNGNNENDGNCCDNCDDEGM